MDPRFTTRSVVGDLISHRSGRLQCSSLIRFLAIDLFIFECAVCKRGTQLELKGTHVSLSCIGNAKQYYRVMGGGWRLSTTVGGRATGEHPSHILCDDSVSVDNAENRKVCDAWKEWYTGTISTRGIAKGAVHVIGQQRVSIYDPSSVALAENNEADIERKPKPWFHVCLPMRYERALAMEDRGFGGDWRTQEGELLYPQLLTEEKVARTAKSMGPRKARAQLQQAPQAIEGQVLPTEKIKFIKTDQIPKCELWVRFWDKAGTENCGCRTAGVLMGLKRTSAELYNYIFTHVHKGQWSSDRVEAEIEKMALGDSMRYGNDTYFVGIEREPGSGGGFSVNATKRRLRNYKVRDIRADKDKIRTAEPLAVAMGFGEVYCVEGQWTPEFIAELTDAPHGEFMDQFDAAAKAIILANEEVGKLKKRALVSGAAQAVEICVSPGCDRPVADGSDYCCQICEMTTQFGDPSMAVDHELACNHRSHKFFNKR